MKNFVINFECLILSLEMFFYLQFRIFFMLMTSTSKRSTFDSLAEYTKLHYINFVTIRPKNRQVIGYKKISVMIWLWAGGNRINTIPICQSDFMFLTYPFHIFLFSFFFVNFFVLYYLSVS